MSVVDLILKHAAAQRAYAMKGRLVLAKSGWLLLEVPNAVMRGVFDAIDEPGIELPTYAGRSNAHISVMSPEDITKLGGAHKITERGRMFAYTLGPLKTVTPKIPGISRVWMVAVSSPELAKLRRSYGLTSLPHADEYEFHITVAQRKVNVLGDNQVTKGTVKLRDNKQRFAELDAHEFVGSVSLKVAEFFRHANRHAAVSGAGPENGGALRETQNDDDGPSVAEITGGKSTALQGSGGRAGGAVNGAVLPAYDISWEKAAAIAASEEYGHGNISSGDDSGGIGEYLLFSAMIKTAAVGIPDRKYYGDPTKIPSGSMQDLVMQKHMATRAGTHFDFRTGGPRGLYSWAMRHQLPGPGEKRLMVQQPMHTYKYKDFEGVIPAGSYGAGKVEKHEEGQLLFTKVSPDMIHFTTAHRRHPERFVLFKPKGWGEKDWMIMNVTPTKAVPYKKVRYKKVPAEQVNQLIQKMQHGETVEAKIDGASSLVKILKDGVELVSYRTSADTGRPIIHTERFFHGRPQHTIDPKFIGTVLKGELYGVRRGRAVNQTNDGSSDSDATGDGAREASPGEQFVQRGADGQDQGAAAANGGNAGVGGATTDIQRAGNVIPPQELGGLLNATVANAIDAQKTRGIQLRNMIYDIQQFGDVEVTELPRMERRQLIEQALDAIDPSRERMHISEAATTPADAQKLWEAIRAGTHPLTREGIVYHPQTGTPSKAKLLEEQDVYVTGAFPGEGKYKDTGAGGFTYSLAAGGPTVGRVGTGFSDALRRDIHRNPAAYTGRVARIRSQQQLPSGAYRSPALRALHEDLPQSKAAAQLTQDEFFNSPPNKKGRKCPGCGTLFKECEPLPDVEMCETCERFGPPKVAVDKKRKPTVAVDMDGTLAKHYEKYDPDVIPDPRPDAKKTMQQWREKGYRLIIFTVRGNKKLVKTWLDKHGIPFDYINENPDQPADASDKLIADVYVDDRAVDGSRSWRIIADVAGKRLEKVSAITLKQIIARAVRRVRLPVSEAQADAGNYRKGHVHLHGLPISIETRAGQRRRPEWPPLCNSYGYIKRTCGKDGDHVDVFLGPNPDVELVYVIDQVDPKTGRFDEHKCMLFFNSLKEAKAAYRANYTAGWQGLGKITPLTIQQFKQWLKTGDQTKPLSKQVITVKAAGDIASILVCDHGIGISLLASQPGRVG